MIDDDRYVERTIPMNYKGGIPLLGFSIKIRNLLEGIVIAVVLVVATAILMIVIPFGKTTTKIEIVVMFGGLGLLIGVKGINDEPIFEWFKNLMSFRQKRRTAFYNPKARKAIPYAQEYEEKIKNQPKEKIVSIYNKVKGKIDKDEQEKLLEFQKTNNFDIQRMYFKDDEGTIDKPIEYMDASERKAYLKAEKARIKKEQKEAIKQKKERRRNEEQ